MTPDEKVKVATKLYDAWQRLIPDARLARPTGAIRSPIGSLVPCFCVNCGASGGYVTEASHVFYLCDGCVAQHGALPLIEVPEELVRGEITEGG